MKTITLKDGREIELNQAFNMDCLEFMRLLPDKCIDLVLTDPPYGIGESGQRNKTGDRPTAKWRNPSSKIYKTFDDSKIPEKEIFDEIFRISKNQIIFGGNYFTEYLKPSKGWIVWDKKADIKEHLSMCELAWTSFDIKCNKFELLWAGFKKGVKEERIHPTQKPVKLFKWCLKHYSNEKQIVFDPFLGSFASAIASEGMNIDWLGCELSSDYFKSGYHRYEQETKQMLMEF